MTTVASREYLALRLPSASDLVEWSVSELPPNHPKYSELGQSVLRSYAIAEFLQWASGSAPEDPYDAPYDQNYRKI